MQIIKTTMSNKIIRLLIASFATASLLSSCSNSRQELTITRVKEVDMDSIIKVEESIFPESEIELIRNEKIFEVENGTILDPSMLSFIPRAREIISTGNSRNMQVRKLGNNYWAIVEMPPSSLWPILKSYVDEYESFGTSSPETGTMTTNWVEKDDNSQTRLLFSVSAGLVPGTSEIVVKQYSRQANQQASKGALSLDFDEKNYQGFLVDTLSVAPQLSSSLVAQSLDNNLKLSTIVQPNGSPALFFELNFDRAWSTTVLALRRADLKTLDVNKKEKWIKVQHAWEITRSEWPNLKHNANSFHTSGTGYGSTKIASYEKTRDIGINQIESYIDFVSIDDDKTQAHVRASEGSFDRNQERLTSLILQNIR